mmetsp:Transcript_26289/g.62522  ORF Transcript_26289/g.62522 Transcript_26289/m.62522 type:complete len:310 (+) Transcript_26289:365-1294(+)
MILSIDNYFKLLKTSSKNKGLLVKNFWINPDLQFLVNKFLLLSENNLIANSLEGGLKIFDIKKKKSIWNLNPFSGVTHDFCLGFNLDVILTLDKSIFFWKKKSKNHWGLYSEIILKNPMEKIIFLPSSSLIISASSNEKKLYLWSNYKQNIFFSGKMNIKENVISIEKSYYSDFFALGSSNGKISVFSQQGVLVRNLYEDLPSREPSDLLFNRLNWFDENILLAGGTNREIAAWDIRMKKKILKLKGHTGNILNLENFGEEKKGCPFFISSDSNGVLKLWDIRKQGEVSSFKIPYRKIYTIGKNFTPSL